MDNLEIVITGDGSHTLKNRNLNETYHSVHGAVQESMHVFINNGLDFFRTTNQTASIAILEIGFGTGLNALLTMQYALANKVTVHYTTLEPHPLTDHVWTKLNHGQGDRESFEALHRAPWNTACAITPEFTLLKIKNNLQETTLSDGFDVIYFDAFAPSVQPELWKLETLLKVTAALRGGGIFVTYSAKGQLKRDLRQLGLRVDTLAGPPGKNEMVRGVNILKTPG